MKTKKFKYRGINITISVDPEHDTNEFWLVDIESDTEYLLLQSNGMNSCMRFIREIVDDMVPATNTIGDTA